MTHMTNLQTVISKLKKTDLSDYPDVTRYENAMDTGLWALWILQDKLGLDDYFTADDLSIILKKKRVSFSAKEILRAFARASKKIDRSKANGKPSYMIMQKGIDYLKELAATGKIQVYFVEGSKPRTDRKMFEELVLKSKGEVMIVDKFYGRESLDMLEKLGTKRKIKFLTARLGDDQNKFNRELSKFKREYKNIEISVYPHEHELHDRYIITDNSLILLGHGLKDLGSKESFVLAFKDQIGKDIRIMLNSKFKDRWKKSRKL